MTSPTTYSHVIARHVIARSRSDAETTKQPVQNLHVLASEAKQPVHPAPSHCEKRPQGATKQTVPPLPVIAKV